MRDSEKFVPLGRLDTDTDPVYVSGGNYVDAKNITHVTNNTESTQGIVPYLGNDFAFDLGEVTQQDKTWRIYTSVGAAGDVGGLWVYDQNGYLVTGATPVTWDRSLNLANQAIDLDTNLTAIVGAVTHAVGVDYIEITITSIAGYDWGAQARTKNGGAPALSDTELSIAVSQEAYDITLEGNLNIIGSFDLLGDLYVWSTPQTYLPTVITPTITTVIDSPTTPGRYRFTTSAAHGLTSDMKVLVSGVIITTPGNVPPNGIWIITVISPTIFDVQEYYNVVGAFVQGATTPLAIVTLYTESVGEIGVAQKNENLPLPLSNQWTSTDVSNTQKYTRLIRSKEFGFRTKKQVDTYCERTSIKDSIYWTDDFNSPRVLYYSRPLNGIFVTDVYSAITDTGDLDGAITIINPHGKYAYDSIFEETRLVLSTTDVLFAFTDQPQAGGGVVSGNWRYSIRFLSDSLAPTEWTDLTNPVNVYSADANGDPKLIIGDEPGTVTGKINNFLVTGIIPGLFKYIELAGVNYVGDAIEGFNLKRILLSVNDTSIVLSHTGTETNITNLDLGTLNFKELPVVTAKNIDVIDSRMILSNITTAQQTDLTAWAQTIYHSVVRTDILAVRSPIVATIRLGEYQDPQNVNNYVGYMHNETYRFGVKVRFKDTGLWSDAFWVDDITIDTSATSPSGRRIAGLTNFDLTPTNWTTVGSAIVYVPHVEFKTIDLDYLVDGVRIRDLIDNISFERVDMDSSNIEVLACGMSGMAVTGTTILSNTIPGTSLISSDTPAVTPYVGSANYVIEYPYLSGDQLDPIYPGGMTIQPKLAAFYSPDIQFSHSSISFVSGDRIINYGSPLFIRFNDGYYTTAPRTLSNFAQYGNSTSLDLTTVQDIVIDDAKYVLMGSSDTFGAFTFWKKNFMTDTTAAQTYSESREGMVLYYATAGGFTNASGNPDHGFYYMQYIRAITDKFGATTSGNYISCGSFTAINNLTLSPIDVTVYGGDTFTQNSYFKHRHADVSEDGGAGAVSFYSQNRINVQMKQKSAGQIGDLFPAIATADWLCTPSNTDGMDGEAYQEGYTIRNQVRSDVSYDASLERTSDLPVRIIWSELKPQGSASDRYRIFLPLNFKDLDLSFGEITHHANGNGELITWQPKKFMRQFFNTRGTLESKGAGTILIGDGSVMSRDGQTISLYGSSHKWSIVKGKSSGGNDVFYWIDTILKKGLRFGYDGTVSIADIKGMQSFFANNLTWVADNDTPADGTGIASVWNDRFAEAIWVVRAHRDTEYVWTTGATFTTTVGQLWFYQPTLSPYATFEKTGELFISKFAGAHNNNPVAVYGLPRAIVTMTGTTVLTCTTAQPHLLVNGDQVKFRDISGLSADINETFLTVTIVSAWVFTVTVSALTNNYVGSSGSIVEVDPFYWTFIEHTNNTYYNEFNLIYNEFKNGYTTFATYLPKIMLKWTDTFLSPSPVNTVSRVYEHNKGLYLTWYVFITDEQIQEEMGYIEGVINKYNDQAKTFVAFAADSDVVPPLNDFTTKSQISYLDISDLEFNEESSYSDIKADSTVTVDNPTGLNNTDADLLRGRWIKTKFYFDIDEYNEYFNTLIEFIINWPNKAK